eukprot:GAHX01000797.1.p1 GENE.GAHX01000797.1~~GAHX01000797.1.p1  ORF type:complete len:221 (+),score=14.65 GAHX01000797.1:30-692(+)
MNIFQVCGDTIHLASVIILLLRIYAFRTLKGLSKNTQICYLILFSTRYLNIFTAKHYLLYILFFKVFYISTSGTIVYLFSQPRLKKTYDGKRDHIFWGYLVAASFALTLLAKYEGLITFFRNFSFILEAVAILPQLAVVHIYANENEGQIETITSDYLFCLGVYRVFYILNWIYKGIKNGSHYYEPLVWACGTVQSLFYIDFIYYYSRSRMIGQSMKLPI